MWFSSVHNALTDAVTNPDDTELVYRKDDWEDTTTVQPMRTHLEIRNGLPQSDFERSRAALIRGRQTHTALGFKNEQPQDNYAYTPSVADINRLDNYPEIVDQCWRGHVKRASDGEYPSIERLHRSGALQNIDGDQIEFQIRQQNHQIGARLYDTRGWQR